MTEPQSRGQLGRGDEIHAMAELGRIQPEQKLACPDCRRPLPDWDIEKYEQKPRCPNCGTRVSLPEEVLERMRQARYLGRNLDIVG